MAEVEGTQELSSGLVAYVAASAQGMILACPLVHGTFQAWCLSGLCNHGWALPTALDLFLGFVEPSLINRALLPGRELGRGPQASGGAVQQAPRGGAGRPAG